MIKKIIISYFLFFLFISFPMKGEIPADVWQEVTPYLLPEDHPIKAKLDRIFSSSRVLFNKKTMKKAGFTHSTPRKFTKLVVSKHPELKGYVIKAYLDAQRYYKDRPEHDFWIMRIQGAEKIRRLIKAHQLDSYFKVPKKWIYLLPAEPAPSKDYYPKYFILVEEDMAIHEESTNEMFWGSDRVTAEKLDYLYYILNTLGLKDCAKPANIPWAKDGRIAFVDTQTHEEWPVLYEKLTPFLSPSMKHYWKQLTD